MVSNRGSDVFSNTEDRLSLDMNEAIGRLWFIKNEYQFRKMDGYGQVFKASGVYEFRLTGNAFSHADSICVSIGKTLLEKNKISWDGRIYTLALQVAADKLNGQFLDSEVQRVPMSVDCFELTGGAKWYLPWSWFLEGKKLHSTR